MAKLFTYRVQGKLPFPTDMLRYDAAWPADTDSALQIASSLAREHYDEADPYPLRTVKLASDHRPTGDRWASFGWRLAGEVQVQRL